MLTENVVVDVVHTGFFSVIIQLTEYLKYLKKEKIIKKFKFK